MLISEISYTVQEIGHCICSNLNRQVQLYIKIKISLHFVNYTHTSDQNQGTLSYGPTAKHHAR